MNEDRDTKLFASLIYLADTLVAGYDVIDVADAMVATCGELLPIDAAGIMVDDQRGGVRVLAATNEEMRLLELLELQANAGPCVEAMASGSTVEVPDLKEAADRWPDFVPQALSEGFHSAYGADEAPRPDDRFAEHVQVRPRTPVEHRPADRARRDEHGGDRHGQPPGDSTPGDPHGATPGGAEHSRIVIEQAKGVIAARANVDVGAPPSACCATRPGCRGG